MGEYIYWHLRLNRTGLLSIEHSFYESGTSYVSSSLIWSQAKPLLEKKAIRELVDPSLKDEYNREELIRLTSTASLCIEQSSLLRPRMSQVQCKFISV